MLQSNIKMEIKYIAHLTEWTVHNLINI